MLADGGLVVGGRTTSIIVNQDLWRNGWAERVRFVIAHELGHALVLDERHGIENFALEYGSLVGNSRPLVERFCNSFAAQLLMPDMYLTQSLALDHWSRINIEDIERASIELKVTPYALAWRIAEHFPVSTGVVLFRYMRKPNLPRDIMMRVVCGTFPQELPGPFVPKYCSITPGSRLESILYNSRMAYSERIELHIGGVRGAYRILGGRVKSNDILAILVSAEDLPGGGSALSTDRIQREIQLRLPYLQEG